MRGVSFWEITREKLKIDPVGMISSNPYIIHENVVLLLENWPFPLPGKIRNCGSESKC
jgi:hypothetical protein